MTIRYPDRHTIDYGVFALKSSNYDRVEAVESSVLRTNLSGNTPATMTVVLESGVNLSTKKFVATGTGNCEFRILDRVIYEIASKMIAQMGHCGEILDMLLFWSDGDSGPWSVAIRFNNAQEDSSDSCAFFDVAHVSWAIPETD